MHPATEQLLRHFDYRHLPLHLQGASEPFHRLAHDVVAKLGWSEASGPEVTVCLRKLLEAKDCAVRAAHASAPPSAAPPSYG